MPSSIFNFFVLVVVLLTVVEGRHEISSHTNNLRLKDKHFFPLSPRGENILHRPVVQTDSKAAKFCPTCVSFMTNSLNELLNIIADGGIIGSCTKLCNQLPAGLEQTVCELLCDYVGIQVFVKIIQTVDPDPIYLCEELTLCTVRDSGLAKFISVGVQPNQGSAGTTFEIQAQFQVVNQTGTGQLYAIITPVEGDDIGAAELLTDLAVGKYSVSFDLDSTPSDDQPFLPGSYAVSLALCEGSCGSIHPHSKIYDKISTKFVITNN